MKSANTDNDAKARMPGRFKKCFDPLRRYQGQSCSCCEVDPDGHPDS
jgi:hypothetical protein